MDTVVWAIAIRDRDRHQARNGADAKNIVQIALYLLEKGAHRGAALSFSEFVEDYEMVSMINAQTRALAKAKGMLFHRPKQVSDEAMLASTFGQECTKNLRFERR